MSDVEISSVPTYAERWLLARWGDPPSAKRAHHDLELALRTVDGYLKVTQPGESRVLMLYLQVSPEETANILIQWLESRGMDPERIPDIEILDPAALTLHEAAQAATGWIATDDLAGADFASQAGIRLIRLDPAELGTLK